ncbi:MAG TPA: crosslink repair DNA glycosylase YcaQ family protein [Chloroflexota bacterium]|nr:crosslink repair DNA glycosylase YcaQ family protein [Chloroflexota bacterium]
MKQTLPARKACYYAKVLRGRGTFISWECFPYFYALYSTGNDYMDDYRAGILSRDEKRILDLVAEQPSISSKELRRKFGPIGKDTSRAMDRAILPLQETFKITVSGGSIEGWSLHNWSLVEDWVPQEHLDKARTIAPQDALKELIVLSVRMSVAASIGDIAWLFRRKRKEIAGLVHDLVNDGRLRDVEIEGLGEMFSV